MHCSSDPLNTPMINAGPGGPPWEKHRRGETGTAFPVQTAKGGFTWGRGKPSRPKDMENEGDYFIKIIFLVAAYLPAFSW